MPAQPGRIDGTPAPNDGEFSETWQLNSTALVRYSALSFNGHRIHYDANYARTVEGYPNLVIHGPLLATLMMDLAVRERGPLHTFRYGHNRGAVAGHHALLGEHVPPRSHTPAALPIRRNPSTPVNFYPRCGLVTPLPSLHLSLALGTLALASCVAMNHPRITSLVVSVNDQRICISPMSSESTDLKGCYPTDQKAPVTRSGDCISAIVPSLGNGPPPNEPLKKLRVVNVGCGH